MRVCLRLRLFVYFDGGSVDGGLEQRHIKTRGYMPEDEHPQSRSARADYTLVL